jgi:hypothetical protein
LWSNRAFPLTPLDPIVSAAPALLGPERARRWLRAAAQRAARAAGPSPAAGALSGGALLAGPEGSGKTEAVFAFAAEAGAQMVYARGADVAANWERGREYVRALFKVSPPAAQYQALPRLPQTKS